MEIALVIPTYNEEKTITKVVKETSTFIKKIIIVNDHSTDSTEKKIKYLPVITLINTLNLGYTKSLEKGIKKAFQLDFDYVITFDADGEHQAVDLEKFIYLIKKKGPDLIIGKRAYKNRFMEEIFGLYSKLRFGFSDPLCGFKAYKKELFIKYGFLEKKYTIGTEIIFRAIKDGASFLEVPIKSNKRQTRSRFASSLKGNILELRAFLNILFI